MNLYQTLNRADREFRMKKVLKESAEVKEIVEESIIEEPTAEEIERDNNNSKQAKIKEVEDRLGELKLELADRENLAPDEREEKEKEAAEVQAELDELLNDCEVVKEDEEVEVSEDITNPIIEEVNTLAAHTDDDFSGLSDEDKEAIKENLIRIKDIACSLYPELCEEPTEEPIEEVTEVVEEIPEEDKEEFNECEVSAFKVVRVAPTHGAFMIEAQCKDGIKYITGKNFNKDTKTLDEAEIAKDKTEATNRFKSLLANK